MENLIDAETAKQLKARFAGSMKGTVDVKVFANSPVLPGGEQQLQLNIYAKQLVKELSGIEPRIIMQDLPMTDPAVVKLGIRTSPSLAIGYDLGCRIIYSGAPLGYEATGFIETLIYVSRMESGLSERAKKALSLLGKDAVIQVFVTPTCPYCPKSVLNANRIAVEMKGRVTAECVESNQNPDLAAKYNVSSVPLQIVNGLQEYGFAGASSEDMMAKKILQAVEPEKYAVFEKEENEARAVMEKLADKPSGTVYISDGNFQDALKKYPNMVIDCWAEWCAPCKALSPVIDALAKEYGGKIVFGKLNIDENPKTTAENEIQSIPAMLVYKDGALKGKIIGAQPKQELELKLKELFGL